MLFEQSYSPKGKSEPHAVPATKRKNDKPDGRSSSGNVVKQKTVKKESKKAIPKSKKGRRTNFRRGGP